MNTTMIAAAIAIAVVLPAGYTIHKGYQEKLRLVEAQIANERSTQASQAETAATLRQIEQYRKRLPNEPSPSWLVTEVMSLGERLGLQLSAIAQEPPQESQQFTRLAVTLEFSASYHDLGVFLDRLEQSGSFIRVEHLDVTPPKEPRGKASVQLTLSTVYLPPLLNRSGG